VNVLSAELRIEAAEGGPDFPVALAQALSRPDMHALAGLIRAGREDCKVQIANNSERETAALSFITSEGAAVSAAPRKCLTAGKEGVVDSGNSINDLDWSEVGVETGVSVPEPYRLMLGSDWGGAKGGGGESGDSGVGCDC